LVETPGACPRSKHLKGFGLALAMPSNSKTWLKRVSKDKPSSLLGLIVGNEGKKFYDIDTWRRNFDAVNLDRSHSCVNSVSTEIWNKKLFNLFSFSLWDNFLKLNNKVKFRISLIIAKCRKIVQQGPYSQNFIFFVTYKWAQ